jgi:hypothetical protein
MKARVGNGALQIAHRVKPLITAESSVDHNASVFASGGRFHNSTSCLSNERAAQSVCADVSEDLLPRFHRLDLDIDRDFLTDSRDRFCARSEH